MESREGPGGIEGTAREQRLRLAGYCGIVGGTAYFAQGVISGLFFPQLDQPNTLGFAIGASIATVTFGLLLVGLCGIAWGGGLGGRLGKGLFSMAALGYALMIVGGVLTVAGIGPLTDPETAVSLIYLLGRLIAVVSTFFTGIAVLLARRWQGWTAYTPLLLGLWPILGELLPVIVTGNTPHPLLNAAWGLWGALLGLATLAQRRSARGGERVAVGYS